MSDVRWVHPGGLRLPPEREEGADQFKLSAQIREFANTINAMPPVLVIEGEDGELQIYDGVTRATRAYLADPQIYILVEVTDVFPQWDFRSSPTIADVA